jgi:hypothetical protein
VDEKGCVRDVRKHAAEIALRKYEKEVRERLERAPSLADFDDPKCTNTEKMGDLDGDGEDDVDVSTCFTGGNLTWIHFLYLSNRGCPKEVGEIRSGEVSSADSKKNGVKDLEATGSNGCAGNDFVWERYRFDGEAYRVIDKATCYLCDGENPPPGANRHPRCQRKWRKEDGRDIP